MTVCSCNPEAKFITREENQWYQESASTSNVEIPGFTTAEIEK